MKLENIGYESLEVRPFVLENIRELEICENINDHIRLNLIGIISEEKKDSYMSMTTFDTPIKILYTSLGDTDGLIRDEESGHPILFQGIITKIEIKVIAEVYYLYISAASYTYLLDIIKGNQSFQDEKKYFKDLVREIIEPYEGADFIDCANADKHWIGNFALRYDQTPWEFLKRIASNLNTGLVPSSSFNCPKFYFGIPESTHTVNIITAAYSLEKDLKKWAHSLINHIPEWKGEDLYCVNVNTGKKLAIGQEVVFQGKILYVLAVHSTLKDGIMNHTCTLSNKWAFKQDVIYNEKIMGISIPGIVIDVKRDKVKVQFSIDNTTPKLEDAHWFPYETNYTTIENNCFYWMPEIGDQVRIYFPSKRECEGVAISSMRQTTLPKEYSGDKYDLERDRLVDHQIKSMKAHGKEIVFSRDRIIIHSTGVSITLHDDDGIDIFTENNINIQASGNIAMKGDDISVEGDKISLSCQGNTINMSSKISIKGSNVEIS